MTFPAKLTELIEKATKGYWSWDGNQLWHLGSGYRDDDVDPHRYTGINYDRRLEKSPTLKANAELIVYLVNHAEAIRDLWVAMEKIEKIGCMGGDGEPWCLNGSHSIYCPAGIAQEALAKLNGGKG